MLGKIDMSIVSRPPGSVSLVWVSEPVGISDDRLGSEQHHHRCRTDYDRSALIDTIEMLRHCSRTKSNIFFCPAVYKISFGPRVFDTIRLQDHHGYRADPRRRRIQNL